MKKIRLYPQLELLNTWAIDRTRFSPDAPEPPLCLRCGQPLRHVLAYNALSRYADVYVCEACGMDEALRDAAGQPMSFSEWDVVKQDRLKVVPSEDAWVLTPVCTFEHIFKDKDIDDERRQSPKTEFAYSRSDHNGYRWWTQWFTLRKGLKTPALVQEIDQFIEALFRLPEMESLHTLSRMCRCYAERTSEPTEFNLYCETDLLYIWLRPIIRERDYNLYVHFYVKEM